MTQPAMGRPARGGYQRPKNPAPASGPGRLSRRTDGGPSNPQPIRDLPNPAYGEQQTFREIQGGAPMSASDTPTPRPIDLSNVTPLSAPTARQGEPVTAGASGGPGPGTEALGLPVGNRNPGVEYLRMYLPAYEQMAGLPQATPEFRNWVRQLRGML